MPRKPISTISYIGYILALIGGLVMILFGLFNLLGVASHSLHEIALLSFLTGTVSALVQTVIGIVCIIGSKFVSSLVWAIILLMLGVVAGTLGGSLVIVGAILGLLAILLKSAPK